MGLGPLPRGTRDCRSHPGRHGSTSSRRISLMSTDVTRRSLLATLPLAAVPPALAVPTTGRAQRAFPDRPVRFVVPYAGGGALDAMARAMARSMGPILGSGATV